MNKEKLQTLKTLALTLIIIKKIANKSEIHTESEKNYESIGTKNPTIKLNDILDPKEDYNMYGKCKIISKKEQSKIDNIPMFLDFQNPLIYDLIREINYNKTVRTLKTK